MFFFVYEINKADRKYYVVALGSSRHIIAKESAFWQFTSPDQVDSVPNTNHTATALRVYRVSGMSSRTVNHHI